MGGYSGTERVGLSPFPLGPRMAYFIERLLDQVLVLEGAAFKDDFALIVRQVTRKFHIML